MKNRDFRIFVNRPYAMIAWDFYGTFREMVEMVNAMPFYEFGGVHEKMKGNLFCKGKVCKFKNGRVTVKF